MAKLFKNKLTFILGIIVISLLLKAEGCNSNGDKTYTLKGVVRFMTLTGFANSGQGVSGVTAECGGNTATTDANGNYSISYKNAPDTLTVTFTGNNIVTKTRRNVPRGQLEAGYDVKVIPAGLMPSDYMQLVIFREGTYGNLTWNPNVSNRELWIYYGGKYPLTDYPVRDRNNNEISHADFIQNEMKTLLKVQFKKVVIVDRAYTPDEIWNMKDASGNSVQISYVEGGLNNFTANREDSNNNIIATYTTYCYSGNKGWNEKEFSTALHELIGRIIGLGTPPDKYLEDYPSVMYAYPSQMAEDWSKYDIWNIEILIQLGAGVSSPDDAYYE